MRKYAVAAAIAVCGVAATSEAQVTPVYTQGNFAITNSSAQIFERFNATTPPVGGQQYVAYNGNPGVTETVTGDVRQFRAGNSVSNVATDPGTGDNYIAIEPGGTFTVSFNTAMRYFSFAVGTLGFTDTVTINYAGGAPSQTLNGLQIGGGTTFNTPANLYQTNGRVTFNAGTGPAFTSIVFSVAQAGSPAFEISDLASAAPEPATWGMMILGFGLAGGALRLRRRKASAVFA